MIFHWKYKLASQAVRRGVPNCWLWNVLDFFLKGLVRVSCKPVES